MNKRTRAVYAAALMDEKHMLGRAAAILTRVCHFDGTRRFVYLTSDGTLLDVQLPPRHMRYSQRLSDTRLHDLALFLFARYR